MFLHVYDAPNQLLLGVIPPGLSMPSVYDEVEAVHAQMASDAWRSGRAAQILLIVESSDMPDALTRRRLAASESRIPRLQFFLVPSSSTARLVLMALEWLRKRSPTQASRSVHATYEQARDRLAELTGISPQHVDALHRRLRELERDSLRPPAPSTRTPGASLPESAASAPGKGPAGRRGTP